MTTPEAAAAVKLQIRASRPAIARVGGAVHLLLRAEPPAPPPRAERRPVAFVLVLDRSGSMAQPAAAAGEPATSARLRGSRDTGQADKLSFVKEATLHLLELMHDGDAVALVTFDDHVQVVKPLTVVSDWTRREVGAVVRALETGGSTYLEGGLRAGLEQFSGEVRAQYGCKLVLLSDGEANVGEQRPAVLAEVAAGAAHNGVTTSSLGVGFDYNIALMNSLAEAGNGDFSHIASLATLDEVLREEFTTAAEVTARAVEVALVLPERLAFGTNLNGYRQETTDTGCKVLLGDLVRPKEFLIEVSTPVALAGDRLTLRADAGYQDAAGESGKAHSELTLTVCEASEALKTAVNEEVLGKLLRQLPALAEMETVLAYETGDLARARAAVDSARAAFAQVQALYRASATERPELASWGEKLTQLEAGTAGRGFTAADMKTRFAASRAMSRGM